MSQRDLLSPYTRPQALHTTTYVQRPSCQFAQLGMPLSRAFQKLIEGGLLTSLVPKPVPQSVPPCFRLDLHCSYHQGPGHDTNHCNALRHAIQDLTDQGLVKLGQPSMTTNPLPTHSTHAVPPSLGDIHHIDLIEDDSDSCPIWKKSIPWRFRFTGVVPHAKDIAPESKSLPSVGNSRKSYLEVTYQRLARGKLVHFHGWKSLALPSVGPAKTTKLCILALGTFPGNLSSKELETPKRAAKLFRKTELSSPGCKVGFHLEVYSSLLAACYEVDGVSLCHQALTPFSLVPDETPFQLTHPTPLVIGCRDTFVPFTLWPKDDDSEGREIQIVTCNGRIAQPPPPIVRPFEIAIEHSGLYFYLEFISIIQATCIVFSDDDLPPEGSDHIHSLYIIVGCSGHRVSYVLLDNGSALNVYPLATTVALGFAPSDFGPYSDSRPWIHRVGAIPFSFHQKVKFIHDGDFMAVSFDQHNSTVVLDMMRGMTFLLGMGLGRRQQGPSEFIATIDHDTTFRLGFIPTETDYRYMARLRKERVRARLSHTPFNYPIRPYMMSFADYFFRGSEIRPHIKEIHSVVHTDREIELQHLFHQLQLKEITDDGVIVDPIEMIDGVVPHDEFRDEMDMMTLFDHQSNMRLRRVIWNPWKSNGKLRNMKNQSFEVLCHKQIRNARRGSKEKSAMKHFLMTVMSATFGALPEVQFMHAICRFKAQEVKNPMLQTISGACSQGIIQTNSEDFASKDERLGSLSLRVKKSRVSTIEVLEGTQIIPVPELLDDDSSLFEGTVSSVEGASDLVDLPLSFDVLLGFVSRSDDVSVASFMDLRDVEIVDFGTEDQPRELKIGSPLSTDKKDRLIHLLKSYLDVFAWSYEDMPGLDPSIVKEEIQKQLSVRFISVVEYPEWLANVIPVPKKDGKVRVRVDFRDLNKASPKDDFPLPHIDLLVYNTAGHSMLCFMDGFPGYNQILMALEDMEKTTFITKWGAYCYKVMPFGLKNVGATYQRVATTLFHDMMHKDVEVYVDDMIVKSQGRADHLGALERFFERIRKFRLRLNPKKCAFGVTSGKLLGHMVNEWGIEVDLDKIKAILDMLALKIEKEIRGFMGRLQYISRFIARLIDICEPIFRLLRKNQPTVWNDDYQLAFETIKEYFLSPHVLVPPTPGRPLLLYLSISDMALGCMLAQIDDSGKKRAIYYLKFNIQYVSQKSIKGSIVADHLASLPISDDRPVDDDFPNEEFVAMTSLSGWCMYFDVEYEACILGLETALELGIRQMEVFGDSNMVLRQIQGDWKTRDVKIRSYHAYLELLVARFDDLRYVHLPRAQNRFADALATLTSSVDISIDAVVRPLLIELRFAPAYYCLIGETEVQDDLPWYQDIYQFLRSGTYPEVATAKDHRALRHLATRFVICGDTLYKRSTDGMLLLCLDQVSVDRVMREDSYALALMQIGNLRIGSLRWGCNYGDSCFPDRKVSPKSSSGHEFILVAIDYFTKWVEAASYVRLTSTRVASFIRSHIICRYEVPYELISDKGVHFQAEISETEWAQARFDQLNLLDEKRLRATDHIQTYQRKMVRAFKKRVIPQLGDDMQLDSQLGGHFAAKGQFRSHFATKEHFHRPFRSCEMRGWGCEMALMCQGVVSQLRNTLRNFATHFAQLCAVVFKQP
ncbi:Transposon Ty3-I Gag-Pol polyprotein [Vitis vinifera]|uniref:Transposon Ty3-I Gag-Pol polyprotein n=1 Tax=Vitis vinifera TaxID=29760 RepID=A0A438IQE2_VITVI|nr:Transposon Ty3-I Gag-Pol polyprotein [Vitis vinifera]